MASSADTLCPKCQKVMKLVKEDIHLDPSFCPEITHGFTLKETPTLKCDDCDLWFHTPDVYERLLKVSCDPEDVQAMLKMHENELLILFRRFPEPAKTNRCLTCGTIIQEATPSL
ncbi:MAG: hypothetical protein NTX72_05665 [Candidatus Uhrbacteria bacterium]|nr:hypothetical protein [Candidatus Uhrbacteria bacterium]